MEEEIGANENVENVKVKEEEEVSNDDGLAKVDEEMIENDSENLDKKEVYLPGKPIKDDEELVCDQSAYVILRQVQTGAPCLSFDIIKDDLGSNREEFPLTSYMVCGTQGSKPKENCILVMKMSNLHKTQETGNDDDAMEDDDDDDDEVDEPEEKRPHMDYASISHYGGVNRIRNDRIRKLIHKFKERKRGCVNTKNYGIINLLAKSVDGILILAKFLKYKTLEEKERNKLCEIITNDIFESGLNSLSVSEYTEISNIIGLVFNESPEAYYIPPTKLQKQTGKTEYLAASGKLINKVHNKKKELQKLNLIKTKNEIYTTYSTHHTNELTNEGKVTADEETQNSLRWLQNNVLPWEKVIVHWETTQIHRLRENRKLVEYFDKYPALSDPLGHTLIESDFNSIYGDEVSSRLINNFNKVFEKLREKCNVSDKNCLDRLNKIDNLSLCQDAKTLLSMQCMVNFVPPKARGPKSRVTIVESLASFIEVVKTPGGVEEVIAKKKDYYLSEKKSRFQPYLVCISPTVTEVPVCYVILDECSYHLESILKDVDLLFKIFQVFNMGYPKESYQLWLFFQKAIYKFDTPYERKLPHCCNVNDTVLAASWSEYGKVNIWDLKKQIQAVNDVKLLNKYRQNDDSSKTQPIFTFTGHLDEGFALDWCKTSPGVLASGDCKKNIHLWYPKPDGWKVNQKPLIGHTDSVEDIQWSPNEQHVLASVSVDKSIRIWDARAPTNKACMITVEDAHKSDINVLHWNKNGPFLATGGDDGFLHVWDLRQLETKKAVATFKHHTAPITTVEWHPSEVTVLASGGEDNQIALWDISVERDTDAGVEDVDNIPPQLLFIHQGQEDIKELHWHEDIPGLIISTAHNGFNIFRTISV